MADITYTYAPGTSLDQMIGFEVAGKILSSYLGDDVNVNIFVEETNELPDNVIGGAMPGMVAGKDYEDVRDALEGDARSADDDIAADHLPKESKGKYEFYANTDDKVKTEEMNVTSANAKAMGLIGGGGTQLDGYILMSDLSNMPNYSWDYDATRMSAASTNQLDFLSVALHETMHVLGFVSGVDDPGWLNMVLDAQDDKKGKIKDNQMNSSTPLDLFRYSNNSGDRPDLSIGHTGANPYFSIDGGDTALADFATTKHSGLGGDGYQASHWKHQGDAIGIMDPALTPGERREVTGMDLKALDVIGWDLTTNDPLDITTTVTETTTTSTTTVPGSTYRQEAISTASGGKVLSFFGEGVNEYGRATFDFSGAAGIYDVRVGYYDENDGVAFLTIQQDGTTLDSWTLNQNLGSPNATALSHTSRTVATDRVIIPGDTFKISGIEQGTEHARIDYIDFARVNAATRFEAEDMLSIYDVEDISGASGGEVWSVVNGPSGETGTASFNFYGQAGLYDVVIGYYDENDGEGKLRVTQGGTTLDQWSLDQELGVDYATADSFVTRTVASGVQVNPGEVFRLYGTEDGGEYARVDYIELVPVTRVEAESLTVIGGSTTTTTETITTTSVVTGLEALYQEVTAGLADQLGQTTDWLFNNANLAASNLSQDMIDAVAAMVESSEIYEWGRGGRGRYRTEIAQLFEQRGLFSTVSAPSQMDDLTGEVIVEDTRTTATGAGQPPQTANSSAGDASLISATMYAQTQGRGNPSGSNGGNSGGAASNLTTAAPLRTYTIGASVGANGQRAIVTGLGDDFLSQTSSTEIMADFFGGPDTLSVSPIA